MRITACLVLPAILLAHAVLWVGLPSQNFHNDGLDEIMRLEAGARAVLARHPLAEPAVQTLLQMLTVAGYAGSAIRLVQVWNGVWMTLALAAVYVLARRTGGSTVAAAGVTLFLGGCYASLHLALDPYLYYMPPGLALMTLASLVASRATARQGGDARRTRSWRAWSLILACVSGAVLFLPMSAAAIPPIAIRWGHMDGGCRARRLLQTLGVLLVPAGLYVFALLATSGFSLGRGPYGLWSPLTLQTSLLGLTGALIPFERGLGLRDALWTSALFRTVLAVATVAPPSVCILAATVRPTKDRRAGVVSLTWLCGAVVSAVFVAWWDAGQARFWLLPLWLLVLGWASALPRLPSMIGAPPQRIATAVAGFLLVEGVGLAAVNCNRYAVPAATRPDPRTALARSMARVFSPDDTIVFPLWAWFHIDYFAGLRTQGLLSLYYARNPGQSTLDVLQEELWKAQRRGGSLFMEVDDSGYPNVSESAKVHGGVDYAKEDFRRVRWGRSLAVNGHVFRKVLAIRSRGTGAR